LEEGGRKGRKERKAEMGATFAPGAAYLNPFQPDFAAPLSCATEKGKKKEEKGERSQTSGRVRETVRRHL